ncbi:MAG: hypothetical protein GKR89_11065 [Candidatus Latescibacteria bacterium]|nr:hypothetical protein [Candidatus Latescibacterota bacterium]
MTDSQAPGDERWIYVVLGLFSILLLAFLALWAVQSGLLAPLARTTTISGRVLYDGQAPTPAKLLVVADRDVCGQIDHFDDRLQVSPNGGIEYAVVSLQRVEGGRPLESMGSQFILDQRRCAYLPHLLLVPVGHPVRILNSDDVFHNIHTYSTDNRPVNIAHPHTEGPLELTLDTPERVSVRCDIHGWMSSWIVAVDHPYHVVTDPGGGFVLADIPPGTYTLQCWQELLGELTAQVTVGRGDHLEFDFSYPPIAQ